MVDSQGKKTVAVKRGVYKLPTPEEEGYLIGSKCRNCGAYLYPQKKVCVYCCSENLEEVALSKRGKIWSYTMGRQTYPGVLLTTPFVVAYVELPEQVYILTLLTGVDFEDIKIGMDVESYFFKVAGDEDKDVIAFAFRPVEA